VSLLQTYFFVALGVVLEGAVLALVFRMCLGRVARRFRRRLRQLEERERSATVLHDTLLQSMQGMILRFQGVSHRLPETSPERGTIEKILDQADEVLAEGRHQILALRVPVIYGDSLGQAFAAIGQSLQESFNTPFRMVITATPMRIDGDRGEEIYGIVREALYNAYQHAEASRIELELVYGCEFFSLYVRDDGKGMGEAPASGYLGLSGMRERAERMGGSVEVLSLPERGTEVILQVPGKLCYQEPRQGGWRHRLTAWLGRTETLG
jgi:signal transduction histidine kinase